MRPAELNGNMRKDTKTDGMTVYISSVFLHTHIYVFLRLTWSWSVLVFPS